MRTFEYREGNSARFWSVEVQGSTLTVRYGKVGNNGRTQVKRFTDEDAARRHADKLVRDKLAKGYREKPSDPAGPPALRVALESALAADPDDLAAHMAYADYLQEQGDPRGEFIRVQLALEDESVPAEARKQLRQRERELLDAHEREWLGELTPLLFGTTREQDALFTAELAPRVLDWLSHKTAWTGFRHGWSRGWLDRFECDCISVEMVRKLGRAPAARLLRAVVFRGPARAGLFRFEPGPDVPDADGFTCEVLAHYPAVANVRIFQYGQEVDPEEDEYHSSTQFEHLAPLLKQMPRLEELYIFGHVEGAETGLPEMRRIFSLETLSNLRVLQHYHGLVYPLEALAANAALGRLTHLLCFPHSLPLYDAGTRKYRAAISRAAVQAVVNSPHLGWLTHLQLRGCDGGDAMISDVIASGVLERLKVLDLRHGLVTDKGARRLAACPHTRNLQTLDLINNRLTETGVESLRAAGIAVRADRQQEPPYDNQQYLYCGDSE
jgi:uncharacterized protein (TIGR02996 family)